MTAEAQRTSRQAVLRCPTPGLRKVTDGVGTESDGGEGACSPLTPDGCSWETALGFEVGDTRNLALTRGTGPFQCSASPCHREKRRPRT